MRAPFVSWLQTGGLSAIVLATTVASPLSTFAAGASSASVNFIDRDALVDSGWSSGSDNPLRAPADATRAQLRASSLRNSPPPSDDQANADPNGAPADEVMPTSYNGRDQNGLQLRPYTPPTGIFSGPNDDPAAIAAAKKRAALAKQQKTSNNSAAVPTRPGYQGYRSTQTNEETAVAAERSKGLIPQFLSFAPKPKNKTITPSYSSTAYGSPNYSPAAGGPYETGPAGLASALTPTTRAGSVAPTPAYGARWRGDSNGAGTGAANAGVNQATYASADAAARSYSHAGMITNGTDAARRSGQAGTVSQAAYAASGAGNSLPKLSNPNGRSASTRQVAVAASYGAASPAQAPAIADNSPAAQLLIQAHAIADKASTESDFSQVYANCRRVMDNQPTPNEAGFAKELAAWALNRRGQIKASAGRTDEALADFSAAVQLDPKLWRAIHNRGVLLAQSGEFEKAFDDFNRTTELNPNFAKAFSNRAALYAVAGQMEPALADYRRACELDPSLAVAQRGCGRTYHMLGHFDEAAEHLNRAIELAPNDASALSSRADLYTDLGNYADATADYERALEVDGHSAEACRGSAWLLATCPDRAIRNPEVAVQRAELAAELERKPEATTYDTLAAAQASAGDFAAATQTIRRAIELAPPSEKSVYQDRLAMYRQSTPFQISPIGRGVRQAEYSASTNR
jgi:tetratricopeptide (TPR) repeat protein